MKKKIVIGTRGSQLALIQTDIIKNKLATVYPKLKIEIKIISTRGDKDKKSPIPLDTIGKDWFSKELDNELLIGTIDLAVHSLKDLSEVLPSGLIIAAILQREDAREAFVSKNNVLFNKIKKSAIIGTDSNRRKAQILHKRPDLIVKSIRGNVDGRLKKLDNGEYDGVFLAVAGLKRLGLENRITEYFSETDIVPSPGQGALAVVIKKKNKLLLKQLQKLNHKPTMDAVTAERSFSKEFGGGCSMPVGAYAVCNNKTMKLVGMIGSVDGKYIVKDTIRGDVSNPEKLGKQLAKHVLKENNSWYVSNGISNDKQCVIVTRPEKENRNFVKQLDKMGLHGFSYPTIAVSKLPLSDQTKRYLYDLASFDWILFTSKNGVRFFIQALIDAKIDLSILHETKIAVVGSKTAEVLKKYQLKVHFIPSEFTTRNLAVELKNIRGKKILLPRTDISTPLLVQHLEKKGVQVVNIPIYRTNYLISPNKTLERLLNEEEVRCITFTSPSTVRGFLENIKLFNLKKSIFEIPVLAIGPITAKTLKQCGFQKIYTADTFNEEGMLIKLKESIL